MALDSKNLVTQKENLFHLHEEIRKMDAGLMDEDTSTISRGPPQRHGIMGLEFGGPCPMLSERHGRETLDPRLFYSFFTFPNFDCGRIWNTSYFREVLSRHR